MAETPSVRNAAQASENPRKNSLLNYESPALTAELQAPHDCESKTQQTPRDQSRKRDVSCS
jgi:hypothetical protein